jgi:hypothetical protein
LKNLPNLVTLVETVVIKVLLKECGFKKILMLAALAISHLLMPAALALLDYHCLSGVCLKMIKNNKNLIN